MKQFYIIPLLHLLFATISLNTEAQALIINEVVAHNTNTASDEYGESDDWIEIYNYGSTPVNLNNLHFSDDLSNLDKHIIEFDLIIPPDGYIVLWADGQVFQGVKHLNFKLSEGETIVISDGEFIIDQLTIYNVRSNISIGKDEAFGDEIVFFQYPTYGLPNTNGLRYLAPITSSQNSGFYDNAIMIGLSSAQNSNIYYTLDGTEPTTNSILYNDNPIVISQNTILSVLAQKEGYLNSTIATNTYLFESASTIPSLFITSSSPSINGVNKTHIHAQLVDESGEVLFSENATSKRHGDLGQPSFKLSFGPSGGGNKIMSPIFKNKSDVTEFKSLVFRQSGNDGLNTSTSKRSHLRDGLISTIVNKGKFNFKAPGFRQVSVYINGVYHGLFNMRERVDESFLESNYKVKDSDSLCFMEYKFGVPSNINEIEGQWSYFSNNLWKLCKNQDLSAEEVFMNATKHLNIENFTDYWIHEVFVGNFDWLSNNMYFWADSVGDAKFRWILWDTDIGLGFNYQEYGNPDWNSLAWSTSTGSGRPWSGNRTAIIRGLLTNENYKNYFINRFCDLLNTEYLPEYTINLLEDVSDNVVDEIPRHIAKWGTGSFASWKAELEVIETYLSARPGNVRGHIEDKFNLENTVDIDINVSSTGAGSIALNTITLSPSMLPWNGVYFKNVALQVTAIPSDGYQFIGWEHTTDLSPTISVTPSNDMTITALFEEVNISSERIVINEISSTQIEAKKSGDWLEIYNPSFDNIDISGWQLQDGSNSASYVFPNGTIINSQSYIVLAGNTIEFQAIYPLVNNVLGDFDFGLSKNGEKLSLLNVNLDLVDVVDYGRDSSWPATEGVQSISLIDTESNNNEGVSWEQSVQPFGSPGMPNNMGSNVKNEDDFVFNIYPNPAIDKFTFDTKKQGFLYIHNSDGILIATHNILNPRTVITFNHNRSGVYYLKFDSLDSTSITKKLLVF